MRLLPHCPPPRPAVPFQAFLVCLLAFSACSPGESPEHRMGPPGTAAEVPSAAGEGPLPADLGDARLDMPGDLRPGYELLLSKCGRCHTAARPLHHRYVEPEGKDLTDKDAMVASLKADHPQYFREPFIWQIESDVWLRCVRRMAAKPGSGIDKDEARVIREFLVQDGTRRKLGRAAVDWRKRREALLKRFRAQYPERYKQLKSNDGL